MAVIEINITPTADEQKALDAKKLTIEELKANAKKGIEDKIGLVVRVMKKKLIEDLTITELENKLK